MLNVLIITLCLKVNAQSEKSFVIATIEKKTTSSLHPLEFDYWIVPESKWDESDNPFMPLYIDGFSKTDIDECCLNDTLILFNSTAEESFVFSESFEQSVGTLRSLIARERVKVLTVKKKWNDFKEEINVYLTPIKGVFCICELKHRDDNSKLGYYGKIAVPSNNFKINTKFWDTQKSKEIKRFDYTTLPFLSLQNMQ